jgi:hypothetical protein
MRSAALVSCLCLVFAVSGCRQTGPDDATVRLMQRVQTLEANAQEMQKKADDLRLKARIVTSSHLGRSPLEDFFNSPEFWENTYDSGQADCARRCIEANQQHRAECAKLPANKQEACYRDALDRVTNCQKGCSRL